MRLLFVLAAVATIATGCKKNPPESGGDPDAGVDGSDSTDSNDGSADAPEPEPAPKPAPAPKAEPDADPEKPLHQQLDDVIVLLEGADVAKHRQALDRLTALAAQHPSEGLIDLNIGVAHQKLDNDSAAKLAYQNALAKNPNLGHAHYYLGMMKEEAGDLAAAESHYRTGMNADPENVDVRVGLVSTLRKQGKLDEAISEAQKALKINSNSAEIYNNVGLAYLERDEYLLAKFMFRKALELPGGEEKAFLHANLGRAYYEEGKIPEATFRLKRAVELDPEYVPGLVYLARVYMDDHNYGDTVDLLERAAKKVPQDHGVQMNLGVAYRGVERFEDAKIAYQKALTIDPTDPRPHFNIGILQGDYLKNYEEAISAFELYKKSGGKEVALADDYIDQVEREKKAVERRQKAEAKAKKREAERKERERLAQEEEEKQKADEAAAAKAAEEAANQPPPEPEAPAPDAPAPDAPAPDAPAPDAPAPDAPAPDAPAPDEAATPGDLPPAEEEPAPSEETPGGEQ